MSLHGILSQDFSSSAIKIVLGNLEEYIRFIGQSIRPISFYNFDNYTVLTKVNVLVFSPKHHTEVFQGTGHHVSNLLAVKKKKNCYCGSRREAQEDIKLTPTPGGYSKSIPTYRAVPPGKELRAD